MIQSGSNESKTCDAVISNYGEEGEEGFTRNSYQGASLLYLRWVAY